MGEIPLERMDWRKWYDGSGEELGKCCTNRGAFITGAALFDNGRFGISAAEATAMDPQQRVSLEVAYEAMEQAKCLEAGQDGIVKGSSGQDRTRLVSSVDLCIWQGQDYSNYV